jgi:NAD(P)H-nitrite reductase large subunit
MKHVIIGNGIAGIQAAETIRSLDPEAEITLISAEPHLPYCRPMISLVLEGSTPPASISIRGSRFAEDLRITLKTGVRVTSVDPDSRMVSTDSGEFLEYDRLLIASGADSRMVRVPGVHLSHILPMRNVTHVLQLLQDISSVKNALVLGGGLVGFKAAHGLMKRGLHVTMVIGSGYPLSQQVDETAGELILDALRSRGLNIRTGLDVTGFDGTKSVREATFSDGSGIPCERVVVGKGVRPAVEFLPKDRIPIDLGILVNTWLETGCPGIYAAGDVAQCNDLVRNRPWINAIWPEAAVQGQIAGMNMAGRPVEYAGSLGRNVIRVYDLDVMTAGMIHPEDPEDCRIFSRHCRRGPLYRRMVIRDNRLVGFVLVNRIEQGGTLVSLIRRKMPLTRSDMRLLQTM